MNKPTKLVSVAAAALFVLTTALPTAAGTTHYRWLDDRGNPVHSDRPPPKGTDYEVITTGSSLIRKVSGDEGAVPPETQPRVGNEFDQIDMEAPAEVEKNPEYCERAQKNLEALENANRIRVRNDQGEMRILSDEEREAEKIKARDAIADHCE